jgi:hypothetical protein
MQIAAIAVAPIAFWSMMYGSTAAFLVELFSARASNSGRSLGIQLSRFTISTMK